MRLLKSALAAVLLLLSAVGACAQEILVFAAASLTESMQEIGQAFEKATKVSPKYSFGASSDLARQIKAGAPADVFFSADAAKMDDLERAGFVRHEDRREFLSNVLAVIVPRKSAARVTAPKDLAQFSRLAIADPAAVPAGIYARKWLEAAGVWMRIEPNVLPTLDVRAALAAVATESVPAGIVYKTDAAVSQDVRIAWTISHGPQIIYSLARVARTSKDSAARFVDFVAGPEGRTVFERQGFVVRDQGPQVPP
jgi:molybdate transport system substrate-binding protein